MLLVYIDMVRIMYFLLSSVNFINEDADEKYSSMNLFSVTKTRRWRAKTNIWW